MCRLTKEEIENRLFFQVAEPRVVLYWEQRLLFHRCSIVPLRVSDTRGAADKEQHGSAQGRSADGAHSKTVVSVVHFLKTFFCNLI